METNTSGIPYNPASVAITGGSISGVSGVAYDAGKWGIPFIACATGTMANNGAMTLGTALGTTYSNGGWFLVPAGAVAAGVPAAATWYWGVASSTTLVTLFNSIYTAGVPTIGTATAFATTGPGAFTGVTAETTGPLITIPAGALGANGKIEYSLTGAYTANVNSKTYRIRYSGGAGTTVFSATATSGIAVDTTGWIQNRGVTGAQVSGVMQAIVSDTIGIAYPAVDTTASSTLAFTFNHTTATDNQVLERAEVLINYAA